MHIDAHCHIYPDEYFEILEKEGPRYGVKLMTNAQGERVVDIKGMMHPPIELFTNVELRLQTMAEMRLDMNILSFSSNPGVYWADDALGEELCQAANDAYAGIIEKHPTKFHGLASLPAQNIPLSVKELERSVNKLGLKGGFLSTNVNGRYLDDESFYPLYEAAAGMNAPIIVHPANPAGKDQMNEYHLFNLVGFPTESANCIGRLIFSGLFDRLPDLTFIFLHGGGTAFPTSSAVSATAGRCGPSAKKYRAHHSNTSARISIWTCSCSIRPSSASSWTRWAASGSCWARTCPMT